ncbi:MAG: EamA family transporter [Solirubrobacteraceae bacterium]|nr:EamA family transporter [Solirubrobacteraceae bacterium]
MAILLALVSAIAYGIADFVGGVVTQRSSAWPVAVVAALTGAVAAVPVALLEGGSPTGGDWLLAAIGGTALGIGSAFLYRGLASGQMTVVAPLSAVTTAVIPVGIGLALGERPSTLAMLGIGVAIPAILLVASAEGSADGASGHQPTATKSNGVVDGLIAGTGFGVLFAAAGRIDEAAGLVPTILMQLAAVVGVVVVAVLLGEDWVPRERSAWRAWVVGPLVVGAIVALMFATRTGLLSVVSVIASLYPAVTVLLAAALLGERVGRLQAAGLALAAAAVSMVAAG